MGRISQAPCHACMPASPWTCAYSGLSCQCLPIAACFARGPAWRFELQTAAANFTRTRDRHLAAHAEYDTEGQRQHLEALVQRVTRTSTGFRCLCGFEDGRLSRIVNHHCREEVLQQEKPLLLSARSSFSKLHPSCKPFPGCEPRDGASASQRLAQAVALQRGAAAHLGTCTLDSLYNSAKLPAEERPQARPITMGDFFQHPAKKNTFCCVWSAPLGGSAKVVDFAPYPLRGGACAKHPEPPGCWRAYTRPYVCQVPDHTEGAPLLLARPLAGVRGFPALASRCYQKYAPPLCAAGVGGAAGVDRAGQAQELLGSRVRRRICSTAKGCVQRICVGSKASNTKASICNESIFLIICFARVVENYPGTRPQTVIGGGHTLQSIAGSAAKRRLLSGSCNIILRYLAAQASLQKARSVCLFQQGA